MFSSASSSFILRSARAFSESNPLRRTQLFARKPSTNTTNNTALVVARREMGGGGHERRLSGGEVALKKMFGLKTLFGFGGMIILGYFSTAYWKRQQYKVSKNSSYSGSLVN